MQSKTTGIILIVVVVVIGGYFLFRGSSQTPAPSPAEAPTKETNQPVAPNTETSEQQSGGEVKEFNMTAKQWEFNPSTITVNQGDTVKLHIESIDVTHGFRLSEFKISEQLEPGKTVNVEFIADKTGTFTFACTVSSCGSGHSGMNGQLVVK